MSQPHSAEHRGLTAPYLQLAKSAFPEGREPDANGFIALSRRDFGEAIARRRQDLGRSQTRIPGDEQLLAVLSKALELKSVEGLGILTRPSAGNLLESLEFRTFELVDARSRQPEQLSDPINQLDATINANGIRLSVVHMFSFSTTKTPLEPSTAVEIQQAEKEAPEEMQELGMGHPQPFTLNYLIKFD